MYLSLLNSARMTASIGILIAAAMVFNYVVTVENIPKTLAAMLQGVPVLAADVPAGRQPHPADPGLLPGRNHDHPDHHPGAACPPPQALGIDPVHFGVVAVVNIMLGLITPPYGLLLFLMVKIAEVPLKDLVREVMPFLGAMVVVLALITVLPGSCALSAPAHGLQGLSAPEKGRGDGQADLHPQRAEPEPAGQARAGDLRHDDARRDRGDVPQSRRRPPRRVPAIERRARDRRLDPRGHRPGARGSSSIPRASRSGRSPSSTR